MPSLIGTLPDQLPTNGDLGELAFQNRDSVEFYDGRGGLQHLVLTAIKRNINVTAIDVFVYDTSKDSDGGAWRNRCQHTSWYNEELNTTIRGSRREFPSVAVIVSYSGGVTIYDGDSADLPMWMVFYTGGTWNSGASMLYALGRNISGMGSLSAGQGKFCVAGSSGYAEGLLIVDLLSEKVENGSTASYKHTWLGAGLVQRNAQCPILFGGASTAPSLVNLDVNDSAITVLPNAPIDAATGLPIPTIAVATNGGTSIIHNNGTVVNITCNNGSYTISRKVDFLPGGALGLSLEAGSASSEDSYYVFNNIPYASTVITVDSKVGSPVSADAFYSAQIVNTAHVSLFTVGNQTDTNRTLTKSSRLNFATPFGLTQIAENRLNPPFGMVNGISSKYNTGWMPGNIKGAWLSDNTAETMVGSGELVTNGTFDSNITGWTDNSGSPSNISYSAGKMYLNGGANYARATQSITTVIGKTYTIGFNVTGLTASESVWVYVGTSTPYSSNVAAVQFSTDGNYFVSFIAASNPTVLTFFTGWDCYIDNVTCRLAEPDRSVNNKGLQVFGSITKSAVATGADLVGYSFPTTSDYFEQPYNSAIGGVGTGDFCVMGWFRNSPSATTWFDIASDASPRFFVAPMYGATDNVWIYMNTAAGTFSWNPSPAFPVVGKDYWQFIAVKRSGITISVSLNGSAWFDNTTITASGSLNSTSRVTIGQNYTHGAAAHTGQMALWRFSQTAPSAEQVAKMYNDEKVLFQDNAKATLYGTSDAVIALAYDEDTNLLHVGTSSGRSVFNGLRRVDNTTDAVGACISAAGGLVVED